MLDRSQIRLELYNFLRKGDQKRGFQINDIRIHFEEQCGHDVCKENEIAILEETQQLTINSILMPGHDWGNFRYPLLRLTEYGRKCIEEENILPFDPDGYIEGVKSSITNIDEVVLIYLAESITTYNRNCLLSSTITLGAASEQAMLLLIEAFSEAISDAEEKASFKKKIEKQRIYEKYKTFRGKFDVIKKDLPAELTREIDVFLDGIFNFIRINRNEAGHPTGIATNKKVVYANLQVFSEYGRRIFDLIEYFQNNKV